MLGDIYKRIIWVEIKDENRDVNHIENHMGKEKYRYRGLHKKIIWV